VTHEGHLVHADLRDRPHVGELLPLASSVALTGAANHIPDEFAAIAALGVTEVVYQPAGSDIEREQSAFGHAAGLPG
jgi:5,10-methylenetetrahydromethanopterin reductase